jgi:hypothetical protein
MSCVAPDRHHLVVDGLWVRTFAPSYFALEMATGIIASGLDQ